MTRTWMAWGLFSALGIAMSATPALAQKWGKELSGQVLFTGKVVPPNEEASVDKDKKHCLEKGPILKNEIVVDKKTKGVANVIVWLVAADADQAKQAKPVPVHPDVKKGMKKTVEIDQPCCVFIPRIVPVVVGQKLVVKNSSPISHNINVDGGAEGPRFNKILPPGGVYEHEDDIPARIWPINYGCNVHGWMKGYLFAVPSPYVFVTGADGKFSLKNVPAGKYRLMAWHEKKGFLLLNSASLKDRGKEIVIKGGDVVTAAPKIEIADFKD